MVNNTDIVIHRTILINYADSNYRKAQKLNTWTGNYIAKFDKVIEYSPVDVDVEFRKINKEIFRIKRGNGLWLWKPYLIRKTLLDMIDGDILFYCDSGAFFIRNVKKLIRSMGEQDIWITDIPLIEKQFTKMDAFILMNCCDEKYFDSNQIQGTFLAIRKSAYSVDFINQWLKYCCDIRILSPNENIMGKHNVENFSAHREDQSILSLLAKRENIKPHLDPTQYGRLPQKYYQKKFLFQIPKHEKEYSTCIILHRSRNLSIGLCFNQLLCAVLPIRIAKKFINNGE